MQLFGWGGLAGYLSSVVRHWKALVIAWAGTAGLFTGLSLLDVSHWRTWQIVTVVVVGLIVAQFRAWQVVTTKNAALQVQVDAVADRSAIRQELADLIAQGNNLLLRIEVSQFLQSLAIDSPQHRYAQVKERVDAWATEAARCVSTNFDNAEAAVLNSKVGLPDWADLSGNSVQHRSLHKDVKGKILRLQRLVESH